MSAWDGLTPPYGTIVADPPWDYEGGRVGQWDDRPMPNQHEMPYSTMSVEEIAAMPVLDLAGADAHLYLWTTNQHLWQSREVAMGWGFEPSQLLTWCKPPQGLKPGGMFSPTTEFVIYARRYHGGGARMVERAGRAIREAREDAGISRADLHRLVRGGNPTGIVARWEDDDSVPNVADWEGLQRVLPALSTVDRSTVMPQRSHEAQRADSTWFTAPLGAHSVKPPAFLDLVERVSPGPYVELFARQPRLGWDSWGHGYEHAVTA